MYVRTVASTFRNVTLPLAVSSVSAAAEHCKVRANSVVRERRQTECFGLGAHARTHKKTPPYQRRDSRACVCVLATRASTASGGERASCSGLTSNASADDNKLFTSSASQPYTSVCVRELFACACSLLQVVARRVPRHATRAAATLVARNINPNGLLWSTAPCAHGLVSVMRLRHRYRRHM